MLALCRKFKLTGLKHTHTLLVVIFLISFLIKTFMILTGKNESLEKYQKIARIPEMLIALAFLSLGVIMLVQIGFTNIGGWFHLKLLLVVIAIPMGIIGFKKNNRIMIIISALLFIYLVLLSFLKTPLLFN